MFEQKKLNTFENYFIPYTERMEKGVYFCRLASYSDELHPLICKYIETTRRSGVCISQRIGNPDEKQLNYYDEIMGREYQLNPNFFIASLRKWLPRVRDREAIAGSFYDIFMDMARNGKNESMQKNAYIKFMCWLYYKFEPILHQLGNTDLPKILFEGYLNHYELNMMQVLSRAGCDILLLEYEGDGKYLQIDPASKASQLLQIPGGPFPSGYSVLELRKQLANRVPEPELKAFRPEKVVNTNTWLKGDPFTDVLTEQTRRGNDSSFFYNMFVGIYGAEDPASYYAELAKWKLKMETAGKKLLLIEETLPPPTFEEIGGINRKKYTSVKQMLNDLVIQIKCSNRKLETYCQNAFMAVMKEESEPSVQKMLNKAVVMVCWLKRYASRIGAVQEDAPVFLFYGELKGQNETALLRMLAKLPLDVIHIDPEVTVAPEMGDSLFFAKKFSKRLKREKFPVDVNSIQFGTAAFQAQQELQQILYEDTGMYRNQQFRGAIPVPLQITYDEIRILWDQEAKYRPNFETFDDRVMVPVISSKVSGVGQSLDQYWNQVCDLLGDEVYLIREWPHIKQNGVNPFVSKAYAFLQYGKLDISKIKNHSAYPFSFIRETMQDYMLQRLQFLIDSKLIVGTGTNGMENTIVSTVLNLDKQLLRVIQKYDFTKAVPKVIVVHTKESSSTVEDAILLAYLNLIGFDIAMFVPTGYSSVERFYTKPIFVEHQIGEYQYDLQIPDFQALKRKRESIAGRLFRRGR